MMILMFFWACICTYTVPQVYFLSVVASGGGEHNRLGVGVLSVGIEVLGLDMSAQGFHT